MEGVGSPRSLELNWRTGGPLHRTVQVCLWSLRTVGRDKPQSFNWGGSSTPTKHPRCKFQRDEMPTSAKHKQQQHRVGPCAAARRCWFLLSILFRHDCITNCFKQSQWRIPVVPAGNKLTPASAYQIFQPTVIENNVYFMLLMKLNVKPSAGQSFI